MKSAMITAIAGAVVITAGATTYIAWGDYTSREDERLVNEIAACIDDSVPHGYSGPEFQAISRGKEMIRSVMAENRAVGISSAATAAKMKQALRQQGTKCP